MSRHVRSSPLVHKVSIARRNDRIKQRLTKAKVLRAEDLWFGVTHREDKPFVVDSIGKLIKAGKYPERLWN